MLEERYKANTAECLGSSTLSFLQTQTGTSCARSFFLHSGSGRFKQRGVPAGCGLLLWVSQSSVVWITSAGGGGVGNQWKKTAFSPSSDERQRTCCVTQIVDLVKSFLLFFFKGEQDCLPTACMALFKRIESRERLTHQDMERETTAEEQIPAPSGGPAHGSRVSHL